MEQQTVFITGASAGFGEACARKFAKAGYSVVISARRIERLAKLKDELSQYEPIYATRLDVRDAGSVDNLIANLPAKFKNITVLVNNAGLALGTESVDKTSLTDLHTMIDTNITGLVNVTHALLPILKQATGAVSIINLASVAASSPYAGSHVYGASKAFVAQFSKNLRCDFAGSNLRVTSLEPGLCESEFSQVRFKGDLQKAAAVYKGTNPIKPEDIANIIYWIANQPAHININSLEVMPTSQAWSGFKVVRDK